MGRDDPFVIRYSALDPQGSGTETKAVANRLALSTTVNFLTQMILSGHGYHIQAGTEDAGVAATAAIDDELGFILADQRAGNVMFPLLYEVTPGSVADTFVLLMAMLECDKEKNRYASGGTVFIPENMNASDQGTFSGVAYAGGDVIPSAKSAVPNSVELARKFYYEDTLADKIGYPGLHNPIVYSARTRPLCILDDAASIIGHLGSTTALATGYAVLELVQFPKGYIVA